MTPKQPRLRPKIPGLERAREKRFRDRLVELMRAANTWDTDDRRSLAQQYIESERDVESQRIEEEAMRSRLR